MAGITLDAGALIQAEKWKRGIWAFARKATEEGIVLTAPAPAIAQAWRGQKSANLARFLSACMIDDLDEAKAKRAGELCGRSGTSDVIDAAVIDGAARRRDLVLTTDPRDLRRLSNHAPGARVVDLNVL